jgi:hypothetical protein
MIPLRKPSWALLILILTLFATYNRASAESSEIAIPEGFHLVSSTMGAQLYQKSYSNGTPDYVQVIYLRQGAAVELLVGELQETRPGKGVFGGDDPRIQSRSLEGFWKEATSIDENAFCVTNGSFFYMPESPTRLPFPLKIDGKIVSDGYAKKEFEGEKLMLALWADRADILELSQEALYASSAPNILGGLHEDANKNSKKYVGRTFVGVKDGDQDGASEIILIFNTLSARTSDAAKALRRFGADKVMMFDGGGSTQLICQGKDYIKSDRYIPQAIAVIAGDAIRVPPQGEVLHAQVEVPLSASADLERALENERDNTDQAVEVQDPGADNIDIPSQASIVPAEAIEIGNVIWVPVAVLSLALLLVHTIRRIQQVN